MNLTEIFLLLLVALILGSALGLERSFAGKTAGVRTFGLVSMGSAMFVIIARLVVPSIEVFNYDPLRMAAGVIVGIGFLCGGVIIFKDSTLTGLTTAAGLWVAAGIGMAVGYGFVFLALFSTVATLVVFTIFWIIEHKIIDARNKNGSQG